MIRNKSRDRILSYGINILILIMIISFCGIPNAFATGIKDLIGLTDNDQTLRVELNISYDKLPQFDENRINQLNGQGKVRLAIQGTDIRFGLKHEYLSRRYTTNIQDLLVVKV